MPYIDIHGKKVHIDEGSHSAKVAAEYLMKHHENAQSFFAAAHHDQANGIAHFEIPHSAEHLDINHHFTLHHHSDGTYSLRKRE